MNVFAVDLSTDACSVAVATDRGIEQRVEPGQRPSRLVLQLAQELLESQDLSLAAIDGIAFGQGPGAFTGLRIAAGVAQGLALSLDRPVIGISSLQALAQVAHREHGVESVAAMLDARMNEVYCGHYRLDDKGIMHAASADELLPPGAYALPDGCDLLAGSGWAAYPVLAELGSGIPRNTELRPDAAAIAAIALPRLLANEGGGPETAIPVYLRDKVAWQGAS